MRISDWSSDVCSSDLETVLRHGTPWHNRVWESAYKVRPRSLRSRPARSLRPVAGSSPAYPAIGPCALPAAAPRRSTRPYDRKSVVWGRGVSVRVDIGGRRIIQKKKKYIQKLST